MLTIAQAARKRWEASGIDALSVPWDELPIEQKEKYIKEIKRGLLTLIFSNHITTRE